MPQIPFPISSSPGVKSQEGAGRLINCYAEKVEQGGRFPVIWKRSAGLNQLVNITGHSHLRGAILVGSTLLVNLDSRTYSVTASGTVFAAVDRGALSGTTPVTCAKNNAATPNIVCVTENGAFNLFTGSAPTAFVDADLPQPNSVAELNGYFLFTLGDGRIFATGLNAVTVASNAFTTEQSLGGLKRGVTFKGEYIAFGVNGAGVYRDIGATPFPLERQTFTIKKGIAGTHAIAGWEPGWIERLIWVADDNLVYQLNGYTPEPIGSDDVVRDIAAAVKSGDGELLEASVYMQGRHAFWRLTYPDNWTWEYNATTQNWNQRDSNERTDCRGSCSIRAFNRWIAGDRTTGKLWDIDESYAREGDDPLIWKLRSGAAANFPARLMIPRADFDFTAAVGMAAGEDPIQTNPKVMIRWSLDGGHSFGNPVLRRLGSQGESRVLVSVTRIGSTKAKGIVYELAISDPVHCGFMGGTHPAEVRAE